MRSGEYSKSGDGGISSIAHVHLASSEPTDEKVNVFSDEARFFLRLGLGKPAVMLAAKQASANGTTIECELLSSGALESQAYYQAFAEDLGLNFLETVNAKDVFLNETIDIQLTRTPMVRLHQSAGPTLIVFSPEAVRNDEMRQRIAAAGSTASRLAVATPQTIRQAIWEANQQPRLRSAVNSLYDDRPEYSARVILSGAQGYVSGSATAVSAFLLALYPFIFLTVLHILLSCFYFTAIVMRGAALRISNSTHRQRDIMSPDTGPDLPIYTVLVPIYREERMLPQLVAALDRIVWPKSRLDIKIICEADDLPTLAAARAHAKAQHYEIVETPAGGPRTKPKALNYALAAARGEFVCVYDVEDRPHPMQLREAYETFQRGPDTLACLQAPLNIANAAEGAISALFAVEYAAQFRSLLPLLARYRMPLPLGGTSNHFRADILKKVGGWDPFNVTEDADLGLRLSRLGYSCGVISSPTLEDAPVDRSIWLAQRSRWFKGWLQTILVHTRNPAALLRDIGPLGILAIALTTGGMLFSALVHPLIVLFVLRTFWLFAFGGWEAVTPLEEILFGVDMANIGASYTLFWVLGRKPMSAAERRALGSPWAAVPLYWLMLSIAAWRAVREIRRNPFLWRKTPHAPAKT